MRLFYKGGPFIIQRLPLQIPSPTERPQAGKLNGKFVRFPSVRHNTDTHIHMLLFYSSFSCFLIKCELFCLTDFFFFPAREHLQVFGQVPAAQTHIKSNCLIWKVLFILFVCVCERENGGWAGANMTKKKWDCWMKREDDGTLGAAGRIPPSMVSPQPLFPTNTTANLTESFIIQQCCFLIFDLSAYCVLSSLLIYRG